MTSKCIHIAYALLVILVLSTPTSCKIVESLVATRENFLLKGHVMQWQQTTNLFSCAHLCSRTEGCLSYNFKLSSRRRGLCELSSETAGYFDDGLTEEAGWLYGKIARIEMIKASAESDIPEVHVTFNSLGAKGQDGPTDTSGYQGTSLEGKVQLDGGIQIWRVPTTAVYSVEAWGASGASSIGGSQLLGGKGARIKGHFKLKTGENLKILVGQKGHVGISISAIPGGGGGGTFVIKEGDIPLVIAGGGGGGAVFESVNASFNGDPGQTTENGTRHGGYSGLGGRLCPVKQDKIEGSGGGGFYGDGESSATCKGGKSFLNGGKGGFSRAGVSNGGFGGGGAATTYPGGGGGFSGGGIEAKEHNGTVAGGGGSFNAGTKQESCEGVRSGDGEVIIKLIK